MARGIRNWTFKEVVNFLKNHDFYLSKVDGSHYYYVKKDKKDGEEYIVEVEVNYLTGGKSYPPLTMKTMITNSGIPEKEWRDSTRG